MTQRDDYVISGLCESDVSQIAEIEKLCFSDPWSEQSIRDDLENPLAVYFVCRDKDKVAGYVGTRVVSDICEITNVAVHPAYRRRGIADRLLKTLEDTLEQVSETELEVREGNTAARALYEKHGFEACGRRKNYYEDPREDAILYTLHAKERHNK